MWTIKYSWAFVLIGISFYVANSHAKLVIVEDVTIKITPERFRCDRITCPVHTDRCLVTKETLSNDLSTMLRSNICFSKTNNVLKKSLTYESVNAKKEIKELMDVHRHGPVNIVSSNDFDKRKFNKEFAQFEKTMSHSMGQLYKDMKRMGHELVHMFE